MFLFPLRNSEIRILLLRRKWEIYIKISFLLVFMKWIEKSKKCIVCFEHYFQIQIYWIFIRDQKWQNKHWQLYQRKPFYQKNQRTGYISRKCIGKKIKRNNQSHSCLFIFMRCGSFPFSFPDHRISISSDCVSIRIVVFFDEKRKIWKNMWPFLGISMYLSNNI